MSDLNQGTWAENIANRAAGVVDPSKEVTTAQPQSAIAAMPVSGSGYTVIQGKPPVPDTEETKRMKENFGFFGPVTFLYAVFYAFCMYKNGSGVTFPFFAAGSLLFLCFSLSKLETTLKKGSIFYMAVIVLLGISTFCTDDSRLIFFNKLGIFLLMMSLLLKQFFDTSQWKLGKYLYCICELVFASFGELGRPFADLTLYRKSRKSEGSKRVWYFLLGLIIGIPILLAVIFLLASADAVFRELTGDILGNISMGNTFDVTCRVVFLFLGSYCLTSCLCRKRIKEQVTDRRKGEPVVAITVTGLLTVLYLLFSVIQIGGLFLGRMQLPDGYTYAKYAREGFFQLLAVSLLNLVIVLVCMSFFKESRLLKGMLTAMSFCTFVMIASSALRMVIYIRFYYLTFLRILVLWSLAVLAFLFAGVVISIFLEKFPLFHYSVVVVSVLYLALSFVHPDYLIARVNVGNAAHDQTQWYSLNEAESFSREDLFGGEFFLASEAYHDYRYLADLSADAAPVLVPYLKELGYHMEAFAAENALTFAEEKIYGDSVYRSDMEGFGYYWMSRMQFRVEDLGIRTFNVSRFRMMQSFK